MESRSYCVSSSFLLKLPVIGLQVWSQRLFGLSSLYGHWDHAVNSWLGVWSLDMCFWVGHWNLNLLLLLTWQLRLHRCVNVGVRRCEDLCAARHKLSHFGFFQQSDHNSIYLSVKAAQSSRISSPQMFFINHWRQNVTWRMPPHRTKWPFPATKSTSPCTLTHPPQISNYMLLAGN